MRKTLAVGILILGIAAATEAQDYTTYRTWSEVVAGIDAKYATLSRRTAVTRSRTISSG